MTMAALPAPETIPGDWHVPTAGCAWQEVQAAQSRQARLAALWRQVEHTKMTVENVTAVPLRNKPLAQVDLAVRHETAPPSVVRRILCIVAQVLILPWGLSELLKLALRALAFKLMYPLQRQNLQNLTHMRKSRWAGARHVGHREMTFEVNGRRVSGLMALSPPCESQKQPIGEQKWVIHATGNNEPIESSHYLVSRLNQAGYHVLLVQGPGAGLSEGPFNPKTLGETQRVALRFLETVIKPDQIILSGYAIGGAAIGAAIDQHEFLQGEEAPEYRVVRTMTFSRISSVAGTVLGGLCRWSGAELDNRPSSRKLSRLGIPEIVVQQAVHGTQTVCHDGVISQSASLAQAVRQESLPGKELVWCENEDNLPMHHFNEHQRTYRRIPQALDIMVQQIIGPAEAVVAPRLPIA
jgi:hypothetical protein